MNSSYFIRKIPYLYLFFTLNCCGQGYFQYNPQLLYNDFGSMFEKDSLRDMYVTFEDFDFHSILVNSFFNNPSFRIPATVSLNGMYFDSVAVRYKGNSTFCLPHDLGNPKLPFNLDFNEWVSGQKILGYKKIKLANAWLDPTFSKEFTASNIYRNYLPTPEVNLLKLHVQDDYLGLYVNTESINKQFLTKHFEEKDGVLFKCDPAGMFCGEEVEGEPKRIFRDTFPNEYKLFASIKRKDHSNLPILLQKIESKLMYERIVPRIHNNRPDIPMFTIHDSIVTTVDNQDYVQRVMLEEMNIALGLNAKTKIEFWRSSSEKIKKVA